jgi:cytochrome c
MFGMDSFELNKIAGVTLGAMLVTFGIGMFSNVVFSRPAPKNLGWTPPGLDAVADAGHGGGAKEAAPAVEPIGKRLAAADAKAGESIFKKNCASCHTIEAGGAAKTGPNLHDVVGRKLASAAGFNYSEAVKSHGGEWSYDLLDHWIASPKSTMSGNKMAYAGEKDGAVRANIIAYLKSQTTNPPAPPAP